MSTMYELAKEIYAKYGVDTDAAIANSYIVLIRFVPPDFFIKLTLF